VHDAQTACRKLQLHIVLQLAVLVVFERVGVGTHAFVHPLHLLDLFKGYARAHQKLAMLVVLKPADTMTRLPAVNQDFSLLRFITKRASQPAVIFMSVRQHDAANVRDAKARTAQPLAQSLCGLLRLRPRIN
jgi:hypothetical protein